MTKIFTLGVNGFVSPQIIAALGLPSHHRQARVLILAPTKRAAAELSTSRGILANARDKEMREATGDDVEALRWVFGGDVLGLYVLHRDSTTVLRIGPEKTITPIGFLMRMPRAIRSDRLGPGEVLLTRDPAGKMQFYGLPAAGWGKPELSEAEEGMLASYGYNEAWEGHP